MYKSILKIFFLSVLFLFHFHWACCQSSAHFTLPSAVCLGENVVIQNGSVNATSYQWDFCHEDLASIPSSSLSATVPGASIPEGIEIAYDEGSWYGFVSSRENNKIFRLEYGNDLNSVPTVTDLGNIGGMVNRPKTIKLVQDKGKWYGFLINYGSSNLVRLDFEAGLNSVPSGTNLGNLGGWSTLRGIDVEKVGADWVVAVSSFNSDKVTLIKLHESITYVPTSSDQISFSNSLISGPMGLDLIEHEGKWYGVLASHRNSKFLHLEFGSDVFSQPVINELGSVSAATDAKLIREGDNYYGFASSPDRLSRIKFGSSPSYGNSLALENLGGFGVMQNVYAMAVLRHSPAWSIFPISYSSNKVHRLQFQGSCSGISQQESIDLEPSGINYVNSGNYSISLTAYNSNGNRDELIKTIIVKDSQAPAIDFTTDNACVSRVNVFTGSSSDDVSISSWTWNFGDGITATGKEVTHQFASVGTYEISLSVITIDGCSNTIKKDIIIYDFPVADFALNTTSYCSNAAISFENTTNIANIPEATFYWNFNGEATSTEISPEYAFTSGGTKEVLLIAELTGCRDTIIHTFNVEEGPIADFRYTKNCFGEAIQFENLSSGEDTNEYLWEFGDGTNSTEKNPSHLYTQSGTFEVKLTVSNSGNCSNNLSKQIIVSNGPLADFRYDTPTEQISAGFYGKDLTHEGDKIESWEWLFPDGSVASGRDTEHTFSGSGFFTVKLKVLTEQGCAFTIEKIIEVLEATGPTIAFALSSAVCLGENVVIQNQSVNSTSYQWDFCYEDLASSPENSLSTIINESNIPVGIEVAYDKGNWYGFVSSRDNSKIFRLDYGSSLSNSPTVVDLGNIGGLVNKPKTIRFIHDKGNWYGFLINYGGSNLVRLDFGTDLTAVPTGVNLGNLDGWNALRGIDVEPIGSDWVVAVSSFNNDKVTLVQLKDSITYVPTLSDKVSISNSLISGPMGLDLMEHEGRWYGILASQKNNKLLHLNFGSDVFNVPVINEIASISIVTDAKLIREGNKYYGFASGANSGLFRIEFGASPAIGSEIALESLGGFGVWRDIYAISVLRHSPEWSIYALSYTEKKIYRVQFQGTCSNVSLQASTGFEPVGLNYASAGQYAVSLTAYDENGNREELTKTITVTDSQAPIIGFTTDNACVSKVNTFTTQNLTPNQTITSYTWTFPDGTTQNTPEASYQFSEPGTYKVRLDVQSDNSCGNFIEKEITVYPEPQAQFNLSASLVCSNAPITFTNQTNFPAEEVISYVWDFKDGNASSEKSPQHTFAEPGVYLVELKATIPGCTSAVTQRVEVKAGPETLFDAAPVCDGETIIFANETSGELVSGYQWDLGDGTYAQVENPVHVYDAPGTYLVQLEAMNTLGCVTSHTQSVRVYSNPVPEFSVGPACAGNEVFFTDETVDADGNIIAWDWEFVLEDGNIARSEEQNPAFTFDKAGTYEVALTATTTWNCKRIIRKTVTVDPVPVVAIGLEGGCVGAPSILSDETVLGEKGVQSWFWKIGDQIFTEESVHFTFPEAGTYLVYLQLNLENGCSVSGTREVVVEPLPEVDFDFAGNCAGQTAVFEATVPAPEYIWNVEGKMIVTEGRKLEHIFSNEGTYTVSLTVADAKGCTNTLSKEVMVGQGPVAAFTANRFKGVPPFKVDFENQSAGAVDYRWFFKDAGNSSSSEENPSFTFTQIGTYEVAMVAFNEAGCSDTVTQLVSVVNPSYDVALQDVHFIEQDDQLQIVLSLENAGTILVSDMEVEVQLNGDYTLSEQFSDTLEIGEQANYSLYMKLLANGGSKISFVCVRLKPVLQLVEEELSVVNNEKCISFDQSFVMQEPYPNPGSDRIMLGFVLPRAGTIDLQVYSSQGVLVEKVHLPERAVGYHQHELKVGSWGKGIYFVRASFEGEERSYRIMKD